MITVTYFLNLLPNPARTMRLGPKRSMVGGKRLKKALSDVALNFLPTKIRSAKNGKPSWQKKSIDLRILAATNIDLNGDDGRNREIG